MSFRKHSGTKGLIINCWQFLWFFEHSWKMLFSRQPDSLLVHARSVPWRHRKTCLEKPRAPATLRTSNPPSLGTRPPWEKKTTKNRFFRMQPASLPLGAAPNRWKMVCWRHRTASIPWISSNRLRCARSYLGSKQKKLAKRHPIFFAPICLHFSFLGIYPPANWLTELAMENGQFYTSFTY